MRVRQEFVGCEGRAHGVLWPGWLEPRPLASKRHDSFFSRIFEAEPELLRLQMLEGRSPPPVQRPPTLHPLRETAGRGERQLIAADCSQSCSGVAFRNQEE
jgi:hypothetical protein